MAPPGPPYLTIPGEGDYQSITLLDSHKSLSFEELRVSDYLRGQGVVIRPSTSSAFLGPPPGLVLASLPSDFLDQIARAQTKSTPGPNPYSSRAIICRVGKEEKRDFVVHEAFITASSEFARTALTKDWKEAHEGMLTLPEDDVAAFDLYQQWLYTGSVFVNRLSKAVDGPHEFELLVKAYLLGERLIDYDFKDAIIDCIIFQLRITGTFDPRLTTMVYDGTPAPSPLRHLWLDIYMWAGNAQWLDEKAIGDFVNGEFLLDLAKKQTGLHKFSPGHAAFMRDSCVYHEHTEGRCYRSK